MMRVTTGRRLLLSIGATIILCATVAQAFSGATTRRPATTTTKLGMVGFLSGGTKISVTASERDNQAIQAIKAAVAKPKTSQLRLIECEFPPLQALNKLGDGSLQSAKQVDDANLAFGRKCCQALSPLIGNRPTITLLTSSSATASFVQKAQKAFGRTASLKTGPPTQTTTSNDIFVLVAPSGRDYVVAKQLATQGATVVLINGFAKDNKSVPDQATMAYFLKPLTYNSQVAGYLVRAYPQPWTTLDAATKVVLGTATDAQILVQGTNTPDLRAAVKAVQQSVDARAIAARQQ